MHYLAMRKIDAYFDGDFQRAWLRGRPSDFARAGLTEELRRQIDARDLKAEVEFDCFRVLERSEFPIGLQNIADPPYLLYVKGAELPEMNSSLAIVGTRKCTREGAMLASQVARDFPGVIVSGLALGIDAAAHQACVDEEKSCVAVLPCGIDRIYPASHIDLAQQILATGGTLVSEYPPGGRPVLKHRFIERNRIISGLSRAVFLVEAGDKSGGLITVRHALDQNRHVFAAPGDFMRLQSAGCNRLLASGQAQMVTSSQAVLEFFGVSRDVKNLSIEQTQIISAIRERPFSLETILAKTGLEYSSVVTELMQLEMDGVLFRRPDMKYQLLMQ